MFNSSRLPISITTSVATSSSNGTTQSEQRHQSEKETRKNRQRARAKLKRQIADTQSALALESITLVQPTNDPSNEPRRRNETQQRDVNDGSPHGTTLPKTRARIARRETRNWARRMMRTGEVTHPTPDRTADDAGRALSCIGYYMNERLLLRSLAQRLELDRPEKSWSCEYLWESARSRANYIYTGRPQWGLASFEHHPILYRIWRAEDDAVTLLLRHLLGFLQIRNHLEDLGFEAPEAGASGNEIRNFWEDLIDAAAGATPTYATV